MGNCRLRRVENKALAGGASSIIAVGGETPLRKKTSLAVLVCATCFAQQAVTDLKALIGKKAIAQRVQFYEPGTYKMIPNTYAGQEVTIIAFKPITVPRTLTAQQLDRLGAQAKAMIEDAQNSGTVVVQFADGTKADTGVILPSLLGNYLELLEPPSAASTPAASSSNTGLSGEPGRSIAASAGVAVPSTRAVIQPRPDELSAEEVRAAVGGAGKNHYVVIEDMGLFAAQGAQVPKIPLYMPDAVLAIRSESARKQFIRYEPEEEERRRAMMIVAYGYVAQYAPGGCDSITRVVLLSDAAGQVVEEPYLSEPLSQTWGNAFGATTQCQALRVKFSLDSVRRVKLAAPNGEFLVAVFAGSVNTKMYKVKKKHQSKLELN